MQKTRVDTVNTWFLSTLVCIFKVIYYSFVFFVVFIYALKSFRDQILLYRLVQLVSHFARYAAKPFSAHTKRADLEHDGTAIILGKRRLYLLDVIILHSYDILDVADILILVKAIHSSLGSHKPACHGYTVLDGIDNVKRAFYIALAHSCKRIVIGIVIIIVFLFSCLARKLR